VTTSGTISPDADAPPTGGATAFLARLAWMAVAVILVGVVVLVIYAIVEPPPSSVQPIRLAMTSTGVLGQLNSIPTTSFDSVDATQLTSAIAPPTVLTGLPLLTDNGKPEVLFVGAEYCPYCAAERWPLVAALSRFGTFTKLQNSQSTSRSVYASLQTFSFDHFAYSSPYLSFSGVEVYSNELTDNGAFTPLETPDPAESKAVGLVRSQLATTGVAPTWPVVDLGNRAAISTSGFSPALLLGQSQQAIVNALSQPSTPLGAAVLTAANQLTAGICLATGEQPAAVCTSRAVVRARTQLARP
jgi:thiol-disulfide isomerase/thioredoxin